MPEYDNSRRRRLALLCPEVRLKHISDRSCKCILRAAALKGDSYLLTYTHILLQAGPILRGVSMAATADAADDRSPLIQALTWFLLLAGFFSICARIVTKYFLRRVMEWDDKLILAAEVGSIFSPSLSSLLPPTLSPLYR